jgi:hypothetical protein
LLVEEGCVNIPKKFLAAALRTLRIAAAFVFACYLSLSKEK